MRLSHRQINRSISDTESPVASAIVVNGMPNGVTQKDNLSRGWKNAKFLEVPYNNVVDKIGSFQGKSVVTPSMKATCPCFARWQAKGRNSRMNQK